MRPIKDDPNKSRAGMTPEEIAFMELCKSLEHYETPPWAAAAILKHEILTRRVFDPCVGTGVLARAAAMAGYDVETMDVREWEGHKPNMIGDYLNPHPVLGHQRANVIANVNGGTVFMNPPFSKAEEFVRASFGYGARKVVCFQRFAWWESQDRKDFWAECRPNRIYICGDRASPIRHWLTPEEKAQENSPIAHAWFVFERGHPTGTLTGHIYKSDLQQ